MISGVISATKKNRDKRERGMVRGGVRTAVLESMSREVISEEVPFEQNQGLNPTKVWEQGKAIQVKGTVKAKGNTLRAFKEQQKDSVARVKWASGVLWETILEAWSQTRSESICIVDHDERILFYYKFHEKHLEDPEQGERKMTWLMLLKITAAIWLRVFGEKEQKKGVQARGDGDRD